MTDLFSSFVAAPHRIQKCPQTQLKTVWHWGHASFAKGLLEPGKGPRRQFCSGDLQIDFRVPGSFAKGISEDEVIDDRKQSKLFSRGHGRPGKCLQALFHVAHSVDAGGSRQHARERPGVPQEDISGPGGNEGECLAPVAGQGRHQHFTHQHIVHGSDQVGLGPDVVIEAHRTDTHFLGDPPHGNRCEALSVGNSKGRGGNLFTAQWGGA